jgi:hypothetical protein
MLSAWLELVAYLYDGRLVALMRAGQAWMTPGSGLFKKCFLSRHALRGVDPKEFAIR